MTFTFALFWATAILSFFLGAALMPGIRAVRDVLQHRRDMDVLEVHRQERRDQEFFQRHVVERLPWPHEPGVAPGEGFSMDQYIERIKSGDSGARVLRVNYDEDTYSLGDQTRGEYLTAGDVREVRRILSEHRETRIDSLIQGQHTIPARDEGEAL